MVQELSTMLELSEQRCGADEEGSAGGKSASFSVLLQYPERRLLFARIAACSHPTIRSCARLPFDYGAYLVSPRSSGGTGKKSSKTVGYPQPVCCTALERYGKRQTGVVLGIILKDARLSRGAVQWLPKGVTERDLESMCSRLVPSPSPTDERGSEDVRLRKRQGKRVPMLGRPSTVVLMLVAVEKEKSQRKVMMSARSPGTVRALELCIWRDAWQRIFCDCQACLAHCARQTTIVVARVRDQERRRKV